MLLVRCIDVASRFQAYVQPANDVKLVTTYTQLDGQTFCESAQVRFLADATTARLSSSQPLLSACSGASDVDCNVPSVQLQAQLKRMAAAVARFLFCAHMREVQSVAIEVVRDVSKQLHLLNVPVIEWRQLPVPRAPAGSIALSHSPTRRAEEETQRSDRYSASLGPHCCMAGGSAALFRPASAFAATRTRQASVQHAQPRPQTTGVHSNGTVPCKPGWQQPVGPKAGKTAARHDSCSTAPTSASYDGGPQRKQKCSGVAEQASCHHCAALAEQNAAACAEVMRLHERLDEAQQHLDNEQSAAAAARAEHAKHSGAAAQRVAELEAQLHQTQATLQAKHAATGALRSKALHQSTQPAQGPGTSAAPEDTATMCRILDATAPLFEQEENPAAEQYVVSRLVRLHSSTLQAVFLQYCQLGGASASVWPPIMRRHQWDALCSDAQIAGAARGAPAQRSAGEPKLSCKQAADIFTAFGEKACEQHIHAAAAAQHAGAKSHTMVLQFEAFVAAIISAAAELELDGAPWLSERVRAFLQQKLPCAVAAQQMVVGRQHDQSRYVSVLGGRRKRIGKARKR